MHSDTVGGTLYSADYAYYLQQTLRSAFGKNFISAFGAGTCGDLNHINVNKKEPVKGFAVAERLGTTLGKTFIEASAHLPTITKRSLAARSTTLSIPLQEPTPDQLADAHPKISKLGDTNTDFFVKVVAVKDLDLERRGSTWPMEVQVFRLDADSASSVSPAKSSSSSASLSNKPRPSKTPSSSPSATTARVSHPKGLHRRQLRSHQRQSEIRRRRDAGGRRSQVPLGIKGVKWYHEANKNA